MPSTVDMLLTCFNPIKYSVQLLRVFIFHMNQTSYNEAPERIELPTPDLLQE